MAALDKYIERRYDHLVRYAKKFTRDPIDLVNYTYIKAVDAGFEYVNEHKADAYFKRGIFGNAGRLKKKYCTGERLPEDVAEVHDMSRLIMFEELDEAVRLLDKFDRELMDLHLSGANMSKVAEESGVPISTIYHSLAESKKKIKTKLNTK